MICDLKHEHWFWEYFDPLRNDYGESQLSQKLDAKVQGQSRTIKDIILIFQRQTKYQIKDKSKNTYQFDWESKTFKNNKNETPPYFETLKYILDVFLQDIEKMGWCPVQTVLPRGWKVSQKPQNTTFKIILCD